MKRENRRGASASSPGSGLFGFGGGHAALVRQLAQRRGQIARGTLEAVGAGFQFVYV